MYALRRRGYKVYLQVSLLPLFIRTLVVQFTKWTKLGHMVLPSPKKIEHIPDDLRSWSANTKSQFTYHKIWSTIVMGVFQKQTNINMFWEPRKTKNTASWLFCTVRTTVGSMENTNCWSYVRCRCRKQRSSIVCSRRSSDVQKSMERLYGLLSDRPKQVHGAAVWFGMDSYYKKLRSTDLWLWECINTLIIHYFLRHSI